MFDNLRGTAACRGELWADRCAAKVSRAEPWPVYNDHVAEIAMRKVADLTADPKLRALLAVECAVYAKRRWDSSDGTVRLS